jgi:TonB family protein
MPAPRPDLTGGSLRDANATPNRPIGRALGSSLLIHGVLVLLLIWGGFHAAQVVEEQQKAINVVYLPDPGPGGGGGGNLGPRTPARPSIPRVSPPQPVPVVQPTSLPQPPPDPTLAASMTTSLSDLMRSNGQGLLNFGATGGGRGTGDGLGLGPGVGRGDGGNAGGGPVRPGNGCTVPEALRQPHPNYTEAAMAAKVQGEVSLEIVVLKDGTVGDVRIVHSLDPVRGLDAEAIRSAMGWRVRPAACKGIPVVMIVSLVLDFHLH